MTKLPFLPLAAIKLATLNGVELTEAKLFGKRCTQTEVSNGTATIVTFYVYLGKTYVIDIKQEYEMKELLIK